VSAGDLPQAAAAVPNTVLRVVRGHPTPEELAALVTVLAARTSSGSEPAPAPVSRWADPRRVLRGPVPPPLGSWRTSGLPG
jgi:acyl-CoA carboxylase epsilon subunit